jgi:hypothetical protein
MMSDESVTPPPTPELTSSPPQTGIMGLLAGSRQKLLDAQIKRLPIPRWDGIVTPFKLEVEYKPVHHSILRRGANEQEKRSKDTQDPTKQANTELDTNADILINGCIRIIAILSSGEEMGLGRDGEYTRFDREAAITCGLPADATARQVCRWFFVTDADLLRTARTISQWSGYTDKDIDEALEGE